MTTRPIVLIFYFLVTALTTACAGNTTVEQPLQQWSPAVDANAVKQFQGDRSPELAVMLAFSGGGTRAAALSYGVLKELDAVTVSSDKGGRTLLQEVDIISSVSGGSFTAAYYGLYGERIFDDFEPRFLRKNVEGEIVLRTLNPVNWFRLASGSYGRSDLAADYYDKYIFDGQSFAAMHKPDRPLVILNATDIASGLRFPFFAGSFSLICADLDSYPVARAVAASSAAPVVFSPIALKSYAGQCGYQLSPLVEEVLQQQEPDSRKIEAQKVTSYLEPDKRPWLHLLDGGVTDNLGLRSFYNTLGMLNAPGGSVPQLLTRDVRNILVISVNAHADHHPHLAQKQAAPSMFEVISSVSTDEMSRYSRDTIEIVRDKYTRLAASLSTEDSEVKFHFVEVSFDRVSDQREREYFNTVPTSFNLDDIAVDKITAAAGQVLRESPEFQAFLATVGGRPTATIRPAGEIE